MTQIALKAVNAKAARVEARKYAPCALNGFNAQGDVVYMSFVRPSGNKYPVATATKGDRPRPVKFVAIVRDKE